MALAIGLTQAPHDYGVATAPHHHRPCYECSSSSDGEEEEAAEAQAELSREDADTLVTFLISQLVALHREEGRRHRHHGE